MYLYSFQLFLLFLILLHCGQKRYLIWFQLFKPLLRLVLWPIIWSVLEDVPCADEKNVYSAAVGWAALWMSIIRSIWSRVQFNFAVSLLIFCLSLSIPKRGVLTSPTITVVESLAPLRAIVCFKYSEAYV
jgi:hypothetical protein